MKSIIASLFAIYALQTSGSRRLLQYAPTVPAQPTNPGGVSVPGGWVAPTLPSLNNPSFNTVLECTLPNTDPEGCAGRIHSIINPSMNFKLTCSNMGACAAATLNFTYVNSMSERVEQVSCSEQFSCFNAKVIIDSTQSARNQYLDKFECNAPGACQGVVIQAIGGASINDVKCPRPEYCTGCEVKECYWTTPGNSGAHGTPAGGVLECGTGKSCFFY